MNWDRRFTGVSRNAKGGENWLKSPAKSTDAVAWQVYPELDHFVFRRNPGLVSRPFLRGTLGAIRGSRRIVQKASKSRMPPDLAGLNTFGPDLIVTVPRSLRMFAAGVLHCSLQGLGK